MYRTFLFSVVLLVYVFELKAQGNLKLIVPIGHTDDIYCLAISPDDEFILSGGKDKNIFLWQVNGKYLLNSYSGHNSPISQILFSRSGKYFVSVDDHYNGYIRKFPEGDIVDTLKVSYENYEVMVTGDNGFIWSDKDKFYRMWDPVRGNRLISYKGKAKQFAISPDQRYLLAFVADETYYYSYYSELSLPLQAIIIDISTGIRKELGKFKISEGQNHMFLENGKWLAIGDHGNTVHLFDVATGKRIKSAPNIIWTNSMTKQGDKLILETYDGKKLWDYRSNKITKLKDRDIDGDEVKLTENTEQITFHNSAHFLTVKGTKILLHDPTFPYSPVEFSGLELQSPTLVRLSGDLTKMAFFNGRTMLWDFSKGRLTALESDSIETLDFNDPYAEPIKGYPETRDLVFYGQRDQWLLEGNDAGFFVHDANSGKRVAKNELGSVGQILPLPERSMVLFTSLGSGVYLRKFIEEDPTLYPQPRFLEHKMSVTLKNSDTGDEFINYFNSDIKYAIGNTDRELYLAFNYGENSNDIFGNRYEQLWNLNLDDFLGSFVSPSGKFSQGFYLFTHSSNKYTYDTFFGSKDIHQVAVSPSGNFSFQVSSYRNGKEINMPSRDDYKGFEYDDMFRFGLRNYLFGPGVGYSSTAQKVKIEVGEALFHTKRDELVVSDKISHAIRVINPSDFTELQPFLGHTNEILSLHISDDGKWMVSTSRDNTIRIWDYDSRKQAASLIPVGETDWIVLHPSGLFDATSGAMDKIYFSTGQQFLELEQMKDRFFEPNLLKKVLERQPLREVAGLDRIDLYPYIETALDSAKAILTVHLTDQGGGFGRTSLHVNGTEVLEDITAKGSPGKTNSNTRKSYTIDLSQFRNFVWGDVNYIGIKSRNREEYLTSPMARILYTSPARKEVIMNTIPRFYGLVIGIADYANDDLDLKYASKDASDMHFAVGKAAGNLFGDNVYLKLLYSEATSSEARPTKSNIKRELDYIASNAGTQDLVFIYFAGHGTNAPGDFGDFLYLTEEARSLVFTDPAIRSSTTLSSSEITEFLKDLLAQKRVIVFDACASGRLVDNMIANREIPSSTLRALERMKDKTGTYILSGCAADAVSYEASQFGQGLLTYSLLAGIRGAALKEDRYVDVLNLFQYAREEVPRLAQNVGGIQEPRIFSPRDGNSFDLGWLAENDKREIPLTQAKPFFVRSSFQDEMRMRDDLGIGKALDEKLNTTSLRGKESPLIFIDTNEFPGAISVFGRYSKNSSGELEVRAVMFRDDKEIETLNLKFKLSVLGDTPAAIVTEELARTIQEKLNKLSQ